MFRLGVDHLIFDGGCANPPKNIVSACFLSFSSTAEPGPRLRIVDGKMRRSF